MTLIFFPLLHPHNYPHPPQKKIFLFKPFWTIPVQKIYYFWGKQDHQTHFFGALGTGGWLVNSEDQSAYASSLNLLFFNFNQVCLLNVRKIL